MLTPEQIEAFSDRLVLGVSLGLACAAGIVGNEESLNRQQLGRLLEALGSEPEVAKFIVVRALEDAASGRLPSPEQWRAFALELGALAHRGVVQ